MSRFLSLGLAFAVGTLLGCGGEPAGADVDSIKNVVELYAQYAATHKGQPPANEAELQKFVGELEAQARAAGEPAEGTGTRFDKYFTSTRDGKRFVVKYGTPVSYSKASTEVLAYEADGVSGKKLVAFNNGTVIERDAASVP
jgi:hypothetical protein